jgi:glycosyl transferase family 25
MSNHTAESRIADRFRAEAIMRIQVINLAGRPDRLLHMRRELGRLGLSFERVEAVDRATVERAGPTGLRLPAAAVACAASHLAAMRRLVESGDRWGVVLEDDVFFSVDARRFLIGDDWIPADVDLVKLETFATAVMLRGAGRPVGEGHRLHELHFRHMGGAAYVVSGAFARRLADRDPASLVHAIDELLFDPRLAAEPATTAWQLVPAIAIQEMRLVDEPFRRFATDIEAPRTRAAADPGAARYRGLLGRLRWASRAVRHRLADRLRLLRQMIR